MGKNKNKKQVNKVVTQDLTKEVMGIYEPNKVQRFFMRHFSMLTKDRKIMSATTTGFIALVTASVIMLLLGFKDVAKADMIMFYSVATPLMAGITYNEITNSKRVKQLCDILKLTPNQVYELERKYYI